MELKTCEYCGTSFDASLRQCPLCGKAVEPSPAEPIILNAGGEPAAPRRHHRRRLHSRSSLRVFHFPAFCIRNYHLAHQRSLIHLHH